LRHGPEAAAGDQPLPPRHRSVRHGGLRAARRRARRGPLRRRPGDDRLDPRVDRRALPGRAPDRGARPPPLLPPRPPRREDRRAHRAVSRSPRGRDRGARPRTAEGGRTRTPRVTPDPETFRFEPDLAESATLPASWYRDPAILERERDRVFSRTWQLVGRAGQVAHP